MKINGNRVEDKKEGKRKIFERGNGSKHFF